MIKSPSRGGSSAHGIVSEPLFHTSQLPYQKIIIHFSDDPPFRAAPRFHSDTPAQHHTTGQPSMVLALSINLDRSGISLPWTSQRSREIAPAIQKPE
jgi:hypothetical protein